MTESTQDDHSPNDAIADVWYQWNRFITTPDILNRADALIELSNKIGDLISWHPNYNTDRGGIDGVYEDDDY